jgi:hypothetical protein
MSEMKIAVRKQPAEYAPGEEIAGGVQWRLDRVPEDTRSFQFTAPLAPYSFTGKLVTLTWAVEVVALPRKENTRVEVVIAPGGKALELAEVGRDQGGAAG